MSDSSKSRVSVDVAGSPDGVACVRIAGEVDLAADAALDRAFASIFVAPRSAVYVDLARIEFAGTTLVHFLYRVIGNLPAGVPVVLCRPTFMTGWLIQSCSLDSVAAISVGLPTDFVNAAAPIDSSPEADRTDQP